MELGADEPPDVPEAAGAVPEAAGAVPEAAPLLDSIGAFRI